MVVRLLLVTVASLLGSLPAAAQSAQCQRQATVETQGYGAQGLTQGEQFGEALAQALAAAITQVQGVFVSSTTELVDYVAEIMVDGNYSVEDYTEFRETFYTQFSGLILEYQVLRTTMTDFGLEVSIRAVICTDPRIAMVSFGSSVAADALAASLADDVRDAGWRVIPASSSRSGLAKNEILRIALETGATLIVVNELEARSQGAWRGLPNWLLNLGSTIYDVRGLHIVDALTSTESAVATTDTAAQQQAAAALASTLAMRLTRQFLAQDERLTAEIRFTGVSRAGTKFDLEQVLLDTRGVVTVDNMRFDEATRTVHAQVALSADFCELARALPANRRMLVQFRSCQSGVAELEVLRE